ncbi:hypothetical protein AB1285_18445 [Microbacterium sp. NRRL B-14842]|uniref:hypothetical protein n=1 Tax=Microbacterium sp. NRRL B-14842 TaxID=3162881 RepID=UPI003D277B47
MPLDIADEQLGQRVVRAGVVADVVRREHEPLLPRDALPRHDRPLHEHAETVIANSRWMPRCPDGSMPMPSSTAKISLRVSRRHGAAA